MEDKTMAKKIYNQPETLVVTIATLPIMQAASPAGNTMGFHDTLGDQW